MLPVPAPLPAPGAMGAPARRPWLFPLVLLAITVGAIAALTLLRVPLPGALTGMRMEIPNADAAPWDALLHNLGLACGWGLYALPVIGMAGILAAGGFDWGMVGVAVSAPIFFGNGHPDPSMFGFTGDGVVIAALCFGAVGWLFAGRLGWSPNSAALLNLPLGFFGGLAGMLLHSSRFQLHQPATAVLALDMTIAVAWLLRRSAVGRELRAIGADAAAARLAGVARGWPMFVAFTLSALGMVVAAPVLLQEYSVVSLVDNSCKGLAFAICELMIIIPAVGGILCVILVLPAVFAFTFLLSLFFIVPFLAIAACGGGLMGRGRVCLSGIVCAGLAVPMLLCALEWLWPENLWHLPLLAALALVGWRVQRARG